MACRVVYFKLLLQRSFSIVADYIVLFFELIKVSEIFPC
jgi:hypothetical protein